MKNMNNTQFGRAPIADPNGTESEVFAQGGGGDAQSTRMATPALGGVNWNKINTSAAQIGAHVQNIAKSISGNKSVAPPITPHLAKINQALAAIKNHPANPISPTNPANNSEADAGSMAGYDPNMGLGNKAPTSLYPRTQ